MTLGNEKWTGSRNIIDYAALLSYVATPGSFPCDLLLANFVGQILFSNGKILTNDVVLAHET
jgi:hypothetical protein